jgi:hypothetical protein
MQSVIWKNAELAEGKIVFMIWSGRFFMNNHSGPSIKSNAGLTDIDLAGSDGYCNIYSQWLAEMRRNGGPRPMEAVAWFLVRAHGEKCPRCHDDVLFLVAKEAAQLNCRVRRSPSNHSLGAAA